MSFQEIYEALVAIRDSDPEMATTAGWTADEDGWATVEKLLEEGGNELLAGPVRSSEQVRYIATKDPRSVEEILWTIRRAGDALATKLSTDERRGVATLVAMAMKEPYPFGNESELLARAVVSRPRIVALAVRAADDAKALPATWVPDGPTIGPATATTRVNPTKEALNDIKFLAEHPLGAASFLFGRALGRPIPDAMKRARTAGLLDDMMGALFGRPSAPSGLSPASPSIPTKK